MGKVVVNGEASVTFKEQEVDYRLASLGQLETMKEYFVLFQLSVCDDGGNILTIF